MFLMPKNNIKKEALLKSIGDIPSAREKKCFCVRTVSTEKDGKPELLISKCFVAHESDSSSEEKYKGFKFLSTMFEGTAISLIEELYGDSSLFGKPPELPLKDSTHWSEELIPSHAVKAKYPLRLYSASITAQNSFNDVMLIGYDSGFHPSAKDYIKEFLGLLGELGRGEVREGKILIELEDCRGRISTDNNALSMEAKDDGLHLVGKVNDGDTLLLKREDKKVIENLNTAELWLLNEQEEIFDYISSTQYPYIFAAPTQAKEGKDYASILDRGEGQTIEFKPYVSICKKDSKIDEIPKTVCAFSNAEGGDLFIGVTDDGEVTDISTALKRDYKTHSDDAQKKYITDLKKLLSENLFQTECFTIHAEEVRAKCVIVVSVTKSTEINSVHNGRNTYIRRGASSMKMLPVEILSRKERSPIF